MTSTAPDGDRDGSGDGSGDSSGRRRRERKAMLLRLDPDLHGALARWAGDELRSTNAHVEWLLARAAQEAGRLRAPRGPDQTR